jgi:Predicted nucleoside-diphosphate sugar epimerases
MKNIYSRSKVLITGAAGTIGQELIKQLLQSEVSEIRGIDNNESELFYLKEKYRYEPRFKSFFCDIRDLNRLSFLNLGVDIVLHTAALKHVDISENSPLDAVATNVNGTANIIQAAIQSDTVKRVIYTSSDKAVNPTNVYGNYQTAGKAVDDFFN